ncbi:protein Sna4p [[Candida] railenensis]|uniref:Protein Sna4p n=1 Tax=[Candida] railenensis TaxID=45579 RepID=A0A9P0VW23_9ASCO|nr:protein Sna4p [[Candida] railenensis]
MCLCLSDLCLVLISVFFPPLPVWIRRGICTCDSLINILLCLLGYIPGLIHSWYIIAKYPPYSIRSESKIYYVYRDSSDLEAGRGSRHNNSNNNNNNNTSNHHVHHCHHPEPVNQQPGPLAAMEAGPSSSYGAVTEGSSSNANPQATLPPPAYTELDNKVQK